MESKSFPGNYSSDVVRVLDTMSFTEGKGVGLLGSMSVRSQQYAGDYDAFEIVNLKEPTDKAALYQLANRFQEIVKDVRDLPKTYIGDIKAGSVEEWRVLSRDAKLKNGKIVGYDATKSRRKIDELKEKKVISPREADYSHSLLKGKMTPIRLLEAKQHLKFHIVRWSVKDVLEGKKRLRDGRTFTLEDAFSTPSITKMDVISYVQNNRYTDFSMIYYFRNNGRFLNPDPHNFVDGIRENIYYYAKKGDAFKVLKRKFSLAKFQRDEKTINALIPILNSDLGRLYHIIGDIGTLISLLEDHSPSLDSVRFEIDQFRNRLANVYALTDYLKEEHTVLGEIESILKDTNQETLLEKLRALKKRLEPILNENTKEMARTKKLKGGAIETEDLFPPGQTQPIFQLKDVVVGTKKEKKVTKTPNPEYDEKKKPSIPPPEGRKGVKKWIEKEESVDVPIIEQRNVKVGDKDLDPQHKGILKAMERMLRALTHFYQERDPAASLGFRVLADDIYRGLPQYDKLPKRALDQGHLNAQKYTAKNVLAVNRQSGQRQIRPDDRKRIEIDPLLGLAFDPRNPIGAKPGKNYSVPPYTEDEAIMLLGEHPEVLGPNAFPRR